MSLPATQIVPFVARSSRSDMRINVDLPEPRWANEEHELALANIEIDVAGGNNAAAVDLRNILKADHDASNRGENGRMARDGRSDTEVTGHLRVPKKPPASAITRIVPGCGGATGGRPR